MQKYYVKVISRGKELTLSISSHKEYNRLVKHCAITGCRITEEHIAGVFRADLKADSFIESDRKGGGDSRVKKRTYRCLTKTGLRDVGEDELYNEAQTVIWSILKHSYSSFEPYHEDIAQDITVIVFRAMERYDPDKGMVYAYIKTIAKRRISSAVLKITRYQRRFVELTDELAAVIPDPGPRGPDDEERELLQDWIDKLKQRCTDEERTVIDLRLDGLGNIEIYNAMHPGADKTRIGSAVSRIWESITKKALELGRPGGKE